MNSKPSAHDHRRHGAELAAAGAAQTRRDHVALVPVEGKTQKHQGGHDRIRQWNGQRRREAGRRKTAANT